jgi:hypothetical protein
LARHDQTDRRPETKLAMLHRFIQAAMGWRDYHLFMFFIGGKEYGIPSKDWDSRTKIYDARRYTLERLFPDARASFRYVYDFGDHWEHTIEIEGAEPAAFRKQYPICVDGGQPCPPEDCGGPPGYARLRDVLRDPKHEDYAHLKAWYDPQHWRLDFDVQKATWGLRFIQRGY